MKRLLLTITVTILGGLLTGSFTNSFEVNAAPPDGLIRPILQAGKTPPGGPIAPQSAPRTNAAASEVCARHRPSFRIGTNSTE
jgi:hypothetical protein